MGQTKDMPVVKVPMQTKPLSATSKGSSHKSTWNPTAELVNSSRLATWRQENSWKTPGFCLCFPNCCKRHPIGAFCSFEGDQMPCFLPFTNTAMRFENGRVGLGRIKRKLQTSSIIVVGVASALLVETKRPSLTIESSPSTCLSTHYTSGLLTQPVRWPDQYRLP